MTSTIAATVARIDAPPADDPHVTIARLKSVIRQLKNAAIDRENYIATLEADNARLAQREDTVNDLADQLRTLGHA